MIVQDFAPELTVNRVYNAILRRGVLDGLWQAGILVRAVPMSNGRWSIDRPPYQASAVVDGTDLIPITHAE